MLWVRLDFYHLTSDRAEDLLVRIAERLIDQHERLLIVSEDPVQREALDTLLWSFAADSFLPHAQSGNDDASQPILISASPDGANDARNVAFADGVWREAGLGFSRAFFLFDELAIDGARALWKRLSGRDDVERRFWKRDDDGRWQAQG